MSERSYHGATITRRMPLVMSQVSCAENGLVLSLSRIQFLKSLLFINNWRGILIFNNILLMYFSSIPSETKVS